MSYQDLERGLLPPTFEQRAKQQNKEWDLLARFKESERRLSILRVINGREHEPTEQEMRQWIKAATKK
jgi:hypothetical protein